MPLAPSPTNIGWPSIDCWWRQDRTAWLPASSPNALGSLRRPSGLAYLFNRACGSDHSIAAPSALIGASNFFELAVAAAISLFGFHSGAALATVVGVLVEVPVMLSVVRIVMATRGWYVRA
jgi:hypothetical protein